DRDRCGRRFGDKRSLRGGHAGYDRDLTADEVGCERRQPIVLQLGKAVFDPHIAALDKASLGETLTERRQIVRSHLGRSAVEKPDHWHRLLPCTRRERPCSRAAEQRYELPPLHSITSSASASSLSGIWRPSALAVLRLMTNSNLTGASTGKSAGLAPFRMRSTYEAVRRKMSYTSGPYDIRPPSATNERYA